MGLMTAEYNKILEEKYLLVSSMSKDICKALGEETLEKAVKKLERIIIENERLKIEVSKYENRN